ncbi:invasion associated locus B family protein [Qipengyuania sp. 6B39]|uniref:invasion associated locus B family protein n=1 Tax=Qipengyuania proteolytica TaxID=2867239 RepID=UPI001C89824B|nr:invasion associated locus B family protein [Qipengyuania proteolytica]MBX7496441.1 invasion associated locus B family protein [Qipengyuania proteolytica]
MRKLAVLALLALSAPLAAKDSLGVFSDWGAFRDRSVPRCYAIAIPQPSRLKRDNEPFATIGTWPRRNLRGQVHFRLSRMLRTNGTITLQVGPKRFQLIGGGGDAWSQDRTMDAAIVAAMRSASSMTIRATDTRGRRFSDTYSLSGAATAMDAATLACARR